MNAVVVTASLVALLTVTLHATPVPAPTWPSGSLPPRPESKNVASYGRWLAHVSDSAAISTFHAGETGLFGNVVSLADGEGPGDSHGVFYTYIPSLDETYKDVMKDPRCSLTWSEMFIDGGLSGGCLNATAEQPTCGRVTITGNLTKVPAADQDKAKKLLFATHPIMKSWEEAHIFEAFWMDPKSITDVFIIDMFGGSTPVTVEQFLAADWYRKNVPKGSEVCAVCGHIYDADKDGGGKAFEALPDNWSCPVCGALKSQYKKQADGTWVHEHHEPHGVVLPQEKQASNGGVTSGSLPPRPDSKDLASYGRWLGHVSDSAAISTFHAGETGLFGNVVSLADGEGLGDSHGVFYTYIPSLDETYKDLMKDPRCALTWSEMFIDGGLSGGCFNATAEQPTCGRVTITGNLTKVPADGQEKAKRFLFATHPVMKSWEEAHIFEAFWMDPKSITDVFIIDMFGGSSPVTVEQFLAADWYRKNVPKGSEICNVCGHIYDADKEGGGKPFESLPDNWTCPVCGALKSQYKKQADGTWAHDGPGALGLLV